jgi:pilus assembly protein CpaE
VILIAEPDASARAAVTAALDPVPCRQVDQVAGLEDQLDDLGPIDAVVVGPSVDRAEALRFAEKLDGRRPVAVLLVARELEPELLREAFRSGVHDVLTPDASPQEWAEAIARARSRVPAVTDAGDHAAVTRGKIVSVFSTKGGSGKSLIASNLAVLAAGALEEGSVGLVDLDLQSGDLAIMLQLIPALSIYDASQSAGRLDIDALTGYLTQHPSGVSLLAAPTEPSLAEQIGTDAVAQILHLMRERFALTVVDGPPLFTEPMLVALDVSDQIVLVGSMDVPSIKNLKLALSTLHQLGHGRDKLRVVLNRADSKVGLRAAEVERSLGVDIDVQIPSSRDVPMSLNQGTPLAISRPKSPVIQAIGELLGALLPEDQQHSGRRRSRRR